MRLWHAVLAAAMVCAAARLPVAYDESYYWTWAQSLSWSYFDHPPGVAFVIAAGQTVVPGLFSMRVLSLLSCAVLIAAHAHGARVLLPDNRLAPQLAVGACFASVMFCVGFLPATPDPFQAALLGVSGAALVDGLIRQRRAAFVIAALTGGLAVMFKVSSLVVVAPAAAVLLTNAKLRHQAGWRWLGLGALLTAPLLASWLVADLGSGASLSFQGERIWGEGWSRPWAAPWLSLGAHMLIVGPSTTVAMLLAGRRPGPSRVLVAGAVAILAAGAWAAARGGGEVNWVMPAFAFAGPTAAVWVADRPKWQRPHRWLLGLGQLLCLVTLAHIVYPFVPMPPERDRTLRSSGFADISRQVQVVAERHNARVVIARRYQTASQLRFHLADALPVHELGTARRSQYDRWPHPPLCRATPAIVLSRARTIPSDLSARRLAPTERVERRRAGRTLTPYFVTPVVMTEHRSCTGTP